MSSFDTLLEECRRQDEEMKQVTAKITEICDKIRSDLHECELPADCEKIELPEPKKVSL